jgi:hypothetical protein
MGSVDSISAYSSDSGEWSENALRDDVAFIRRADLFTPGYLRKGDWVRAKMSEASRKVELDDPIVMR